MSSLDMLRGLAIVMMALDHVRDFRHDRGRTRSHGGSEYWPMLFATRWINYFCASTFVFLAGTTTGSLRGWHH